MYLLYKPCEPGWPARHISRVHNQSHNKFYFTPSVLGSVWPHQDGWGLALPCTVLANHSVNVSLLGKPRVNRRGTI